MKPIEKLSFKVSITDSSKPWNEIKAMLIINKLNEVIEAINLLKEKKE